MTAVFIVAGGTAGAVGSGVWLAGFFLLCMVFIGAPLGCWLGTRAAVRSVTRELGRETGKTTIQHIAELHEHRAPLIVNLAAQLCIGYSLPLQKLKLLVQQLLLKRKLLAQQALLKGERNEIDDKAANKCPKGTGKDRVENRHSGDLSANDYDEPRPLAAVGSGNWIGMYCARRSVMAISPSLLRIEMRSTGKPAAPK